MREKRTKLLLLCLAGAVATAGCGSSAQKQTKQDTAAVETAADIGSETSAEAKEEKTKTDVLNELYVITRLDTKNQVLEAKCAADGKWRTCSYSGATYFYDKYGQSVSVENISCGKIVTLKENAQTGNLSEVRLSDAVWEYTDVQNPQIDTEQQTITMYGETYFYGSHYWVYSQDTQANLSDITEQDILAITGIDKKILSIRITTGHGTVKLKNTELFEGGWLKLGSVVCKITKDMTFSAPEGTYDLSVANDGYGDTKSVTVARNQTLEIDLNDYKGSGPKMCTITFHCDVEGAVLRINGDQVDYSSPVELKYGTYALSLSADGYDTISRYLIVSSPTAEIDLTMTSNGSGDSGSQAGSEEDTQQPSESTSEAETTQPQAQAQDVQPGALAGTLAGTQTGADDGTTSAGSTDGVTDPFADTGKTQEDTLGLSGSESASSQPVTESEKQAIVSMVEQLIE